MGQDFCCMRNGKGQQTVWGIEHGAANTCASKGKKCHNTGNRAGYLRANCNLDPLELEFWKDFWTRDSTLQALTFAQIKIFKSQFSSQPQSFL